MKINRRTFIKGVGGTAALLPFTSCNRIQGQLYSPLKEGELYEKIVPTFCSLCEGCCSARVRVVRGDAVSLRPNPLGRGDGICPKAHALTQVLYDPDRLKGPVKNTGNAQHPEWKEISWKEAIQILGGRLKERRDKGFPHSLVALMEEKKTFRNLFVERFFEAYGSPNLLYFRDGSSEVNHFANYLMQGYQGELVPDWKSAHMILSFGCPLLESSPYTARFQHAYGQFQLGDDGYHGQLIQIEPRYSLTALKADEWLPLSPGTEGMLALGIAHCLIKSGKYDKSFVENFTLGFEKWEDTTGREWPGFKDMVLGKYAPEAVSRVTQVSSSIIKRLAGELYKRKPAIALPPLGSPVHSNSVFTTMAIHSLNALLGNLGKKGGLVVPPGMPFPSLGPVEKDEKAKKGLQEPLLIKSNWKGFRTSLRTGEIAELAAKSKQIDTLLIGGFHPSYYLSGVASRQLVSLIEKVPFVVSFSSYLDETSKYANLILPDHTPLERWDLCIQADIDDGCFIGLQQPVVEPFRNTLDMADVLIRISHSIPGKVNFVGDNPWSEVVKRYAGNIANLEQLLRDGVVLQKKVFQYEDPKENFQTRSGKFEFFAEALKERIQAESRGRPLKDILREWGITEEDEVAFLPHYEPPQFSGSGEKYPLYLFSYKNTMDSCGQASNAPWLLENFGYMLNEKWNLWIEIHPKTALKLGIREGDLVRIDSQTGCITAKAKLYEGLVPEVIAVPLGIGGEGYGRWSSNRGDDVKKILGSLREQLSGQAALGGTRVSVAKI